MIHRVAYANGAIGDNFVYLSSKGANFTFVVQNLSTNNSLSIMTPFRFSFEYPVESSFLNGEILIYLNGTAYSYSQSGKLLWVDQLPFANSNNYGSIAISYGNSHILFYTLVLAFVNDEGGINYRVTYEAISIVDSVSGQVEKQRMYSPLVSILNDEGPTYVPFMVNNGSILYSWYSNGNLTIAKGEINSF